MKIIRIILIVFICFVFTRTAPADDIYLKDGTLWRSKIIERTDTYIKVETSGGRIYTHLLEDVKQINNEKINVKRKPLKLIDKNSIAPSGLRNAWPPKKGTYYPDIEYIDLQGRPVKVQDFKGKIILIEYVGISCPACQSLSGSKKYGSFKGVSVMGGMTVERQVSKYAHIQLDDPRIEFMQILLFNRNLKPPTLLEANEWALHFHMHELDNVHVWIGKPNLLNQKNYKASYDLIPGLQLIDKDLIIQADSTGHRPVDHIRKTLLPMIDLLLNGGDE